MRQTAIACSVFRGGTSKGLYFHAADLPADRAVRDAVLLAALGSPDARQIDGLGGAHPLTSKIAVVSRSGDDAADVDYLFLQVWPERAAVADSQNCGNLLAAVGPFAVEEGLVAAADPTTTVRVRMLNTDTIAVATVATPGGAVDYDGTTRIDGVPGSAAAVPLAFGADGPVLPTGHAVDTVAGVAVTCLDRGMPVVCVAAADLGVRGDEPPAALEADAALTARVEEIRLAAGALMGLGDVTHLSTPKVSLLSAPRAGGAIATRTFIPHRVHEAIGVLGAVSVAAACAVEGSVAARLAVVTGDDVVVEHPSGSFTVRLTAHGAALVRTARLLLRGQVFVPASVWDGR